MVIWFNVEKARRCLLDNGFVFTLRPKRRKRDFKNPKRGYVEVLSYNGFGKKGLVFVSFVKEIENINELKEYVEYSGFETLEEWLTYAKESRYLYFVMLLDNRI